MNALTVVALTPSWGCLDAELVDTGGGPGRFWGYRGLRPALAIRQVTPAVGVAAGRVLRRWYRAKGLTKSVRRARIDQTSGRTFYRTTTVRKRLFCRNRGFVAVNDGPGFASQLARYLTGLGPPCVDAPRMQVNGLCDGH